MIRDNDAVLALGARPIQQYEPAARHNGAQRGATANIDGAPVYALHMAQSPDQQAESLPRYDDSPPILPKKLLAFRSNCSEPSRNRQA